MIPLEHLHELLQAGSPWMSQDLQSLLHPEEQQHILTSTVKLQNSTGSNMTQDRYGHTVLAARAGALP